MPCMVHWYVIEYTSLKKEMMLWPNCEVTAPVGKKVSTDPAGSYPRIHSHTSVVSYDMNRCELFLRQETSWAN